MTKANIDEFAPLAFEDSHVERGVTSLTDPSLNRADACR